MGLCTVCNKANARLCSRCKSACYCSATCQRADWPTHKLLCAAFSTFDVSSRPTDEHLRAILFPVDGEKPKFIWLHCEWHDDDDFGKFQYPETDTIIAITATKPGRYHDWRGPIIAYSKVGPGINPTACKDLDMNDFRHIADCFLSYGYEPAPATEQSTGEKLKGVRINCIGDQKMFDKPHFEAVEIPSTDPIFSKHDTSDIAQRIGLPIFTRRCPPNPKWASDRDNAIFHEDPFNNQDATFLHLCCDPKADFDIRTGTLGWGWASQQWQNSVGSVVVVRQDMKPLSPLHVEALCRYCRHEIRPLLAHSIGEYEPEEPMAKEAVLSMICRPTFVIYWNKLLDEKRKEGEDTSAPWPYDV
ncbi:hypothetical protein SLS58_007523 [Diplodia intermedia]|uniref:MYND-type domain-containing protein n=1 Tax=Diplodia intermedia TaxID=856260 RepID=A0ABR3TJQ6_9PEZI